jgi:hypothetical protein
MQTFNDGCFEAQVLAVCEYACERFPEEWPEACVAPGESNLYSFTFDEISCDGALGGVCLLRLDCGERMDIEMTNCQ